MRLIDADKLLDTLGIDSLDCEKCSWGNFDYCKRGSDFVDACSAIEDAPTVDAVPLEDYKSMEQTVNKLTKAIADAEPTEEQVKEYCHKRCLVIVTSELFNEIKARWSAEPVKHGHWVIDMHGNWACSLCGNDPYHDNMKNMNYCPNCGAKMDVETGNTYSIGQIELPNGVFRQIYDEERREDAKTN